MTTTSGTPRRTARAARRLQPLDVLGIAIVAIVVTMGAVGPILAGDVSGSNLGERLLPPSAAHWFGTDDQGRDIFGRVVSGARETLVAAVLTVAGYSVIGVAISILAVTGPRWLGEGLMRFTDVGLAFPSLIFALGITSALGPGLDSAVIALVVTGWPMTARMLTGIMRETMVLPYVESSRVLGVSRPRLMFRHVLPNAVPALWVKWSGDVGNTVLLIGALSFIGAGAQPPSAEWGAMVSSARSMMSTAWWAAFFPGLMIAITTAGFGLLGDFIHRRTDPDLWRRS